MCRFNASSHLVRSLVLRQVARPLHHPRGWRRGRTCVCGVCFHLPRRAARPSLGPLPRNPTLVSAASQRPTRRASLELAGVCRAPSRACALAAFRPESFSIRRSRSRVGHIRVVGHSRPRRSRSRSRPERNASESQVDTVRPCERREGEAGDCALAASQRRLGSLSLSHTHLRVPGTHATRIVAAMCGGGVAAAARAAAAHRPPHASVGALRGMHRGMHRGPRGASRSLEHMLVTAAGASRAIAILEVLAHGLVAHLGHWLPLVHELTVGTARAPPGKEVLAHLTARARLRRDAVPCDAAGMRGQCDAAMHRGRRSPH